MSALMHGFISHLPVWIWYAAACLAIYPKRLRKKDKALAGAIFALGAALLFIGHTRYPFILLGTLAVYLFPIACENHKAKTRKEDK